MTNAKALNSIRVKSTIPIVTLAISIILLLAASSWMLKMQEHSIQLQADKFVQSISLTLNADRDLYQAKEAELNLLARYGDAEAENASRVENAQQVADRYAKYQTNMQDYPDVLEKSSAFQADFAAWKQQSDKLVAAIGQASPEEISALRQDAEQKFSALRDNLDKAGEAALSKSVEIREHLAQQLEQFQNIAMAILGVILIGALWLGYSIPRNIARQLHQSIDTANAIAAGDLSTNIDIRTEDETGQLLNAMKHVQGTLQSLLQDMDHMSQQHDAGDIDVHVDESKFQGDFQKMATGVNKMVDGHIQVKRKPWPCLNRSVKAISGPTLKSFPAKKRLSTTPLKRFAITSKPSPPIPTC